MLFLRHRTTLTDTSAFLEGNRLIDVPVNYFQFNLSLEEKKSSKRKESKFVLGHFGSHDTHFFHLSEAS